MPLALATGGAEGDLLDFTVCWNEFTHSDDWFLFIDALRLLCTYKQNGCLQKFISISCLKTSESRGISCASKVGDTSRVLERALNLCCQRL